MNKRDGGWRTETGGMKARGMETGRELWFLMDKTIFLSSRKYELALLTKNRVRALLKIAPYRHPKFGGFQKKPYLCTAIQRYHPHWFLRMARVNQSSLIINH